MKRTLRRLLGIRERVEDQTRLDREGRSAARGDGRVQAAREPGTLADGRNRRVQAVARMDGAGTGATP